MKRPYYREPDVEYGRPEKEIGDPPPGFSLLDTGGWDARRFLIELANRQGEHEWRQRRGEWQIARWQERKPLEPPRPAPVVEGRWPNLEQEPNWSMFPEAPGRIDKPPPPPNQWSRPILAELDYQRWRQDPEDTSWDDLTLVNDPDEINRLLDRPPAVGQITSKERAAHALDLGMILVAVDPRTPDLVKRLNAEAKDIRAKHLLPIKARGRPSGSTDVAGITGNKLGQWRYHRIVDLYDLINEGYDPHEERKQLAAWLFPGIRDQALAMLPMIDAQTRKARHDP
jgi:hypothetical protein